MHLQNVVYVIGEFLLPILGCCIACLLPYQHYNILLDRNVLHRQEKIYCVVNKKYIHSVLLLFIGEYWIIYEIIYLKIFLCIHYTAIKYYRLKIDRGLYLRTLIKEEKCEKIISKVWPVQSIVRMSCKDIWYDQRYTHPSPFPIRTINYALKQGEFIFPSILLIYVLFVCAKANTIFRFVSHRLSGQISEEKDIYRLVYRR